MKTITGVGLLWFCLIFMFKNAQEGGGTEAPVLIPAVPPEMCICFEYYFKHLSKSERTIYHSCDPEVLDYNEDHSLEIFTLNVPCDSVFEGTRIIIPKQQPMKTLDQINQKIDQIRATIPGPKTKKELGQIQKQLGILIVLKGYLASNPNPELVYRQLDLINQKIIEYKKRRIPLDNMLKDNRKVALQDLNKKFQITKLRKQKKALEYLLGEAELSV